MLSTKKINRKPQKRKKKTGPKFYGSKKIVKFNETQVGHLIFIYAPIEYNLLIEYNRILNTNRNKRTIQYNLIESIAINSSNPIFKTVKFRKAMIAYRRTGMHPLRKTGWTLRDAVYFSRHSYKIHQAIKKAPDI